MVGFQCVWRRTVSCEDFGPELTRRGFLKGGTVIAGGLAVGPTVVSLVGCRREGASPAPATPPQDADARPTETVDAGPDTAPERPDEAAPVEQPEVVELGDPLEGYDVRYDLLEQVHLADVDHGGTFIDFGTGSHHKYTLGGWRSGWGDDDEEEGVPFTWAGASPGRLYFHLDEPTAFRVVLRVKRRSSDRISLYVNDRPVDRIEPSRDWSVYRIDVEASQTNAGENSIKLVHSSRSDNGRGFAIDYLRIIPSSSAGSVAESDLPRLATLRNIAQVGSEERPALSLRAPSRLSYFVELPENTHLGFSLGLIAGAGARASVRVTPARSNEVQELHDAHLSATSGWTNEDLDLSELGGQVVRLDFAVEPAASAAAANDAGGSAAADAGLDAAVATEEPAVVGFATPALMTRPARLRAAVETPPRHVVVLLIDTLRADKLTAYGRTRVQTPELSRFAEQSTLFQRCQAPANWTKPSCASVLTGLHPPSHRALTDSGALPGRIPLVSEHFQRAGYQTAAMIANGYMAGDFGFDKGWNFYRNYIRERLQTEAEHVFEEAAGWLERNSEERTFTYIQTIDPHVPYDPPDSDLRLYDPAPYSGPVRNRSTGNLLEDFKRERVQLEARDRARLEALYDGEVTYHDRYFGRFIARLTELGLLDSTLLIITADHGEEFFEHDSVGHGHSLYQELLHVPLMMRFPGLTEPGAELGQVCSLVDIAPTILEASGLDIPEDMEGRSLVGDLRGAPAPVGGAAFSSQWDTGNNRELGWTARIADWKLRMRGPAISYLYDLDNDPREQRDVDRRNPIALRAARIALGQFLGSGHGRNWAAGPAAAQQRPRRRRPTEPSESQAEMTPELCQQLRALGYMADDCD